MSPRAVLGVVAALLPLALALAGCGPGVPAPVENRMAVAAPAGQVIGRLKDGSLAIRVRRGDTAYGIARRHNVSLRALIERNRLAPPYTLRVGQVLAVPRAQVYTVRKGDTLYAIAKRHAVDLNALIRVNGVRPPYTIHVGQSLRLPDRWDQGATATARAQPPPRRETSAPPPRRPETAAAPPPAAQPTSPPRPASAAVRAPPSRVGGFIWPVQGEVISRFGGAGHGLKNDGINIAATRGATVIAAESGVVAYAGNELRGFGNLLLVKHQDGWMTAYAHLAEMLVARGDTVERGQAIGKVGASGNVKTPQLHFELRRQTRAVDPLQHLRSATAMLAR